MTSVRNILDDMSIVGKDLESLNGYQRNNYTEHGKQVTNSKVDKLIFSFNECVYQHQACRLVSKTKSTGERYLHYQLQIGTAG